MTILHTTNYGVAYIDGVTPLSQLAQVSQEVAQTVDAALGRGGVAPVDATSLAAEAATRKSADDALAARAAKLEAVRASCRRYSTAATAMPAGATTAVPMTSTDWTRGAGITASGAGIAVTAAGLYLISAGISYTGGTTGYRIVVVRKNGTSVREFGPATTNARVGGTDVIVLAANDLLDLAGYVDIAATAAGSTNPKDVYLSVTRLDP